MTGDRRRPAPVAAEHLASDATIARLAERAVVKALAAARPTQVARLAAHKTIVGLSEDAGCEPTWLANAVFDAIADVGGVVHHSNMDSSSAKQQPVSQEACFDQINKVIEAQAADKRFMYHLPAGDLRTAVSERIKRYDVTLDQLAASGSVDTSTPAPTAPDPAYCDARMKSLSCVGPVGHEGSHVGYRGAEVLVWDEPGKWRHSWTSGEQPPTLPDKQEPRSRQTIQEHLDA